MPVFYNPLMAFNRDVSVLLLNSLGMRDMRIGLPLAGTGIRGIRFMLELGEGILGSVRMNDQNPSAAGLIRKNIRKNRMGFSPDSDVRVSSVDGNMFLMKSPGFDYIDVDPFGSPNPFLDSAVRRLSRRGILAVTATDTAALCGTYPRACLRKYWAVPRRDEQMHETGLRILIRKVQLVGAQYDKALLPVFSYSKDHYFRVFFRCSKGKAHADRVLAGHGMHEGAGPMWLGRLWDERLADAMHENSPHGCRVFLRIVSDEARVPVAGFFDVHAAAKEKKAGGLPRMESLLEEMRSQGFLAQRTHFLGTGIRTDMDRKTFMKLI
jgi:tRNA (guanine26-N2/guanine27-N2)-dimethyltransferase